MSEAHFLKRIDALVESGAAGTLPSSTNAVAEVARLALLAQHHQELGDPLATVCSQATAKELRRFAAICILRLISAQPSILSQAEQVRHRLMQLFDQVLAADLYPVLKIGERDQTYVKQSALEQLVPRVERDVDECIASLRGREVGEYRQRVLRALNSGTNRPLVVPFLPRELVEKGKLATLFDAVENYLTAGITEKPSSRKRACELLEAYERVASDWGTAYSQRFLVELARRLHSMVERDFSASPLSGAPGLRLLPTAKKYPLAVQGAKVSVRLSVGNDGPGYAQAVTLRISDPGSLRFENDRVYVGNLEPGSWVRDIRFPAVVAVPAASANLKINLEWQSFDSSWHDEQCAASLETQRSDVPWESLATESPYSLNPVSSLAELAGRRTLLNKLVGLCRAVPTVSVLLYGKRRVGKTSIINALRDELTRLGEAAPTLVYVDIGEILHPEADTTIRALGERLTQETAERLPPRIALPRPQFTNALAPLVDYARQVEATLPERRYVFVLDEFDGIPGELQKRGPVADAFFQTIRSLSGRRNVGFILVGGENMQFIINNHGQALNKFQTLQVDAFNRESEWSDYSDLVRNPVRHWCEISEEAIAAVYEESGGNPFFTKLVCGVLATLLVDRRDSDATYEEMSEAIRGAVQTVGVNKFAHFWDDGLLDVGRSQREQTLARRQVLLALAEALRGRDAAPEEEIARSANEYSLDRPTVARELREFERRDVLRRSGDSWRASVRLFEHWLVERGVRDLIASVGEAGLVLRAKEQEESIRVAAAELTALVDRWGSYQGVRLTPERVRSWLEQFGRPRDQRLMFKLLEKTRFYSGALIKEKLAEVHGHVRRDLASHGIVPRHERPRQKRSDLLVAFLDQAGKSSAYLARTHADTNGIYVDQVVEAAKVGDYLKRHPKSVSAVVLVDDFIGTGSSAKEQLGRIDERVWAEIRDSQLSVYLLAVAGFRASLESLARFATEHYLPVDFRCADILEEQDRAFSDKSAVFSDPMERSDARDLAESWGRRLVNTSPLGFGGSAALVVFEHRCPNNTLPIFWADSKKESFRPLFPRQP